MSEKKDLVGFGFYHFDPRWTSYRDFDALIEKGYINNLFLSMESYGTTVHALKKLREVGGQAWLCPATYFSKRQTIEEYMDKVRAYVDKLKKDELFDLVVGFHWDEPLLKREHTNDDFLAMTKALSEEYGLRIYPVFSAYEVLGRKGNATDPEGTKMLESYATKYITDVGYDSYGYDFRTPSTETMQNRFKTLMQEHPEMDGARGYYKFYMDALKQRCVNPDVKIWVYPCSYLCYTWGGFFTDEDYCVAHLNGLKDLLLEEKNRGGIMNYTYKSWSESSIGVEHYLHDSNPDRWTRFEEACKKAIVEINE